MRHRPLDSPDSSFQAIEPPKTVGWSGDPLDVLASDLTARLCDGRHTPAAAEAGYDTDVIFDSVLKCVNP
jgi:hypothetical protein